MKTASKSSKKNEVIRSTYPMVNSPEEVNVNGKYSTLNFGMFKKLQYNRGEDTGIDANRLNRFKKLYYNNEYFNDELHLFVNEAMEVIDGHHKLALHIYLFENGIKLPINFTVLTQAEYNEGTPIQKMGAIARRNAVTSKWDSKAHFNVALKLQLPLAIAIQNLKAEGLCIDGRMMTAPRIFALLTSDTKRLNSELVSVEEYDRPDLIDVMSTEKFKKEYEFVCNVINELIKWNKDYEETAKIIPFNMIRAIMPMVWENMLNMDKFVGEIQTKRFANVSNTVKGCTVYAKKIQKKMLGID
ncbi:MAG: hypothetical protein JXA77_11295 [Bacteroidales bacterium]|nr:hypothetical protein [Bacteroidales bacterium]